MANKEIKWKEPSVSARAKASGLQREMAGTAAREAAAKKGRAMESRQVASENAYRSAIKGKSKQEVVAIKKKMGRFPN